MSEEIVNEELEELESVPDLPPAESESASAPAPQKSRRLPQLLRLTRRSIVFFTLSLLAIILFFMTGNRQLFLDSNLNLILQIISFTSIFLALFTLAGILGCIFYLVKDKKIKYIVHTFAYILILIFSIVTLILSLSVNLLSEGIDF